MARKRKKPGEQSGEGWETADRVRWLLETHWKRSRSEMATAIKMSVTGLIKVVTRQQQPGRQLLTAIVSNSDVNPMWLLTGQGPPFTSGGLPVADEVLPGPPARYPHVLTDRKVDHLRDLFSPSRYWLRLRRSEPVTQMKGMNIQANDLLLLETDRALFPPREQLRLKLCVVTIEKGDQCRLTLAQVMYHDPDYEEGREWIEADTFERPQVTTLTIVEDSPGEPMRVFKRLISHEKPKKPGRLRRRTPLSASDTRRTLTSICYDDIVAVCVLLVRDV